MRGAVAGVAAAAAWAAGEPVLKRVFGTPYSDVRLLGRVATRSRPDRREGTWPRLLTNRRIAGQEIAGHALFGAVLGALTRR